MSTTLANFLERLDVRFLMLLVVSVAAHAFAFAQEEKLYYFVDEHGVPHISNTLTDPRYKPYTPGKRGQEPAASSHAEQPTGPEEAMPSPLEDVDDGADPPDAPIPADEPKQKGAQ